MSIQEKINKKKNSFFLGQKWKIHLQKINTYPKNNSLTATHEKKEIIFLNQNLKSKLSPFFFSTLNKK